MKHIFTPYISTPWFLGTLMRAHLEISAEDHDRLEVGKGSVDVFDQLSQMTYRLQREEGLGDCPWTVVEEVRVSEASEAA
jgi:hypothetical protein